jgi:hypothetical protein
MLMGQSYCYHWQQLQMFPIPLATTPDSIQYRLAADRRLWVTFLKLTEGMNTGVVAKEVVDSYYVYMQRDNQFRSTSQEPKKLMKSSKNNCSF